MLLTFSNFPNNLPLCPANTLLNILSSGSPGVSGQQSFLETPQSFISAPGDQVTLSCLVQNKGGECRWQKDGKVTYYDQ